jgi:3-isopropylmalate dehydratase small subunit
MSLTKVIGVLGDKIPTTRIYPTLWRGITDPSKTPKFAFGNDIGLNDILINKTPGEPIALVCGDEFGCGTCYEQAITTLKGHRELSVIVKKANDNYNKLALAAGFKIIQCPDLNADDTDVDDELEIQTNKVINKTKNREYPIKP